MLPEQQWCRPLSIHQSRQTQKQIHRQKWRRLTDISATHRHIKGVWRPSMIQMENKEHYSMIIHDHDHHWSLKISEYFYFGKKKKQLRLVKSPDWGQFPDLSLPRISPRASLTIQNQALPYKIKPYYTKPSLTIEKHMYHITAFHIIPCDTKPYFTILNNIAHYYYIRCNFSYFIHTIYSILLYYTHQSIYHMCCQECQEHIPYICC